MDGAYNWWETLDAEMLELGYYCSKADLSVHSQHADRNITIMSTYMDDTTGISLSHNEAERAKEELGWNYEVKDLGEANMILGIHVKHDREAGTVRGCSIKLSMWLVYRSFYLDLYLLTIPHHPESLAY